MALKITSSVAGPLVLTPADNPLKVTGAGVITSTGANIDGVDGGAGTDWNIVNQGTISSDGGWGVNLAGDSVLQNAGTIFGLLGGFETAGSGSVTNTGSVSGGLGGGVFAEGVYFGAGGAVTNAKSGSIDGGVDIEGAYGVVTNNGAISKTAPRAYAAVFLDAGGIVTNGQNGAIVGTDNGALGVNISNGVGVVTNKGAISGGGGVFLGAGGNITNAKGGSIVGDGRRATAIDVEGGVGVITNAGTINGSAGWGVYLGAGGSVTNATGGVILSGNIVAAGVEVDDGLGTVTNNGEINGAYGNGVVLDGGGSVTNRANGSIDAGLNGVGVGLEAFGVVTNMGKINGAQGGGVYLADGGSVSNTASGQITAGLGANGVDIGGAGGLVVNAGAISASGAGVDLEVDGSIMNKGTISGTGSGLGVTSAGVEINAGSVTNEVGGLIKGVAYGIATGNGPVTVTNDGTISGGTDSVLFGAGSTGNRLVIAPAAIFKGAADATQATDSTIELTAGTGAIKGIGNGGFVGFNELDADAGGNWTLKGANSIATVLNDGKLEVSGGLVVTTAIDPNSTGTFVLDPHATLEVGEALGAQSSIDFNQGSELVVDHFALFGQNVGTASYAGPLLKDFGGSTIDLEGFGLGGLVDSYSSSSGLLQLTNSAAQVATLDLQPSGLGAGTFSFKSDGSGGTLISHA